jgi:hypothetical protein
MRGIQLLLMLAVATSSIAAQETDPLRHEGEATIIGFQLRDSPKFVSVCESQGQGLSYIVYRFGAPSKVELEYPRDLASSWESFEYSYYFRPGGASNAGLDLNYLSFTTGGWKYVVYDEYSYESNTGSIGIKLFDLQGKRNYDLPGRYDSLRGSLSSLRDEPERGLRRSETLY